MSTSINGTTGIDVSAVSSSAITADRTSTDGTIIDLQKDGTTVGSIGVDFSDNLTIDAGSGESGLNFATSQLAPYRGGASADAAIDLGLSSVRWKDLYLSGGVYLGGTGSDNKISDYEVGSYTPVFSAGPSAVTYNVQVGTYTKVGNLVVVAFAISMTAFSGTATHTKISLPFTSANTSNLYHPSCLQIDNLTADNRQVGIQINPNTNDAILIRNIGTTGAHDGLNSNRINSTSSVRGTVVYRTA